MSFFSNRRDRILMEAIDNAFLLNEGVIVDTRIHWKSAEKFAQDRGAKTDIYEDGGQSTSLKIMMHSQEVLVIFTINRMDGTTHIMAENLENQLKRFNEKLGL